MTFKYKTLWLPVESLDRVLNVMADLDWRLIHCSPREQRNPNERKLSYTVRDMNVKAYLDLGTGEIGRDEKTLTVDVEDHRGVLCIFEAQEPVTVSAFKKMAEEG